MSVVTTLTVVEYEDFLAINKMAISWKFPANYQHSKEW